MGERPLRSGRGEMNNESTLQLIYQYCQEQGYTQALETLQSESGVQVDSGTWESSRRLRQILNEHWDLMAVMAGPDPSSLDEMTVDQGLKIQEHHAIAGSAGVVVPQAHNSAGLITGRVGSYGDLTLLATSSSSREVKIWDASALAQGGREPPACVGTIMCTATCLSLDFHPHQPGTLLMGLMDGTVRVMKNVHQDSREDVWQGPVHAKYVVRAKWGPEDYFATGSYDRTVHLHRMSAEGEYSHVQKWSFGGNVESIEFTPDQIALIVSARGDNYLSYIQLRDLTISRIDMNATGDDHVSFTAMHVECSPGGDHLLVQTDKDRIIVMRTHTPIQSKNLYGTVNNEFSQPRATWHPSGKYIFGTSQNNMILAWDVITEQVVERMYGHTAYPRDLCHHPTQELLFSCSYDKSWRAWVPGGDEQ